MLHILTIFLKCIIRNWRQQPHFHSSSQSFRRSTWIKESRCSTLEWFPSLPLFHHSKRARLFKWSTISRWNSYIYLWMAFILEENCLTSKTCFFIPIYHKIAWYSWTLGIDIKFYENFILLHFTINFPLIYVFSLIEFPRFSHAECMITEQFNIAYWFELVCENIFRNKILNRPINLLWINCSWKYLRRERWAILYQPPSLLSSALYPFDNSTLLPINYLLAGSPCSCQWELLPRKWMSPLLLTNRSSQVGIQVRNLKK